MEDKDTFFLYIQYHDYLQPGDGGHFVSASIVNNYQYLHWKTINEQGYLCISILTKITVCLKDKLAWKVASVGNSHGSASLRLTTLEEDQELFIDFSSILC